VTPRTPLLLCLLLAGCSTPPVDRIPSGEADRKEYWKGKTAEIQPDWDRPRLEDYLERVRVHGRLPLREYQGTIRMGTEGEKHYNRYRLDDDFDLFVAWKEDGKQLLSAEVSSFWDLHDRVDPELFPALRHLHRAPSAEDLWSYDPILLIRAVNAVLALGGKAHAALRAYDDLSHRLRFEEHLKYGIQTARLLPVEWLVLANPPLSRKEIVQFPDPLAMPDAKSWPLFPFTLEQGLPFLVNGLSTPPLDPSRPAVAAAALRAGPLMPSLDPVAAVEELTASPRWEALLNASDRFNPPTTRKQAAQLKLLVRGQALQALAPVYTPPPDEPPQDCCKDPAEVRWTRIVEEVRDLHLRWDPVRQDFVRSR
jgi:hypothetical protein